MILLSADNLGRQYQGDPVFQGQYAKGEEQARSVYEGVEAMTPDDIAACIVFALTRPAHVNVDEFVVKARAQSSGGRILRT